VTAVPFLDLTRETVAFRDRIDAAIDRVLSSGVFVLGPEVEAFETNFARYCERPHAVGVASGTDAIAIALRAAGVEPGDEVIAPANTCVPTIAGIEHAGAVPVLADAEAGTYGLDPVSFERAISARTRAVVVVHLYGKVGQWDEVAGIARARGLILVEDAAQAHGASYRGKRAGCLGDVAAFSFYPTKNLGAVGDAGAVVTGDPVIAERARRLRAYGEHQRYESHEAGWNSRLDPLQAAILGVKLASLDSRNARRAVLARRYRAGLAGLPGLVLPESDDSDAHHLFVIQVENRARVRARLAERGIGTLVHYPIPIHRHPAYASLGQGRVPLDVSERLSERVLSLPLYPELEESEAETVIEALREELTG
jgi:dTDP-4-amino-4,6-dideoxygalactose transaminase